MRKHQLASYRKQFPGIDYIGLTEWELLASTVRVCVADETLMTAKATWEENGDGRYTDLHFKDHSYYGFGRIDLKKDPAILRMGLSQQDEMRHDLNSVGPNGHSKYTVADLFKGDIDLVVIIEVLEESSQSSGKSVDIRIHKINPGFKPKRSE